MDWSKYPSFSKEEMKCKHCGECHMDVAFMEKLQHLRYMYGKPMSVTSGYRCEHHPKEAQRAKGGAHTLGKACDVAVSGEDAYKLAKMAMEAGFTGIGVKLSGPVSGRFLHLDTATKEDGLPRPTLYSY